MTGAHTGAARAGTTPALAAAGLALGVSAAAQVVRHDGAVTSALLVLVFLLTAGVAPRLGGTPHRSLPAALLALGLAVACPGGRWALLLGGACCAVAAGVVTAALVPRATGGVAGTDGGSGSGSGSVFGGGGSVRVAVSVLGPAVVVGWVVAAVRLPEARAAASAVACCCGLLQLTRTPVPG